MLVRALRWSFLLLSAAWLGLSGVALPILYTTEEFTAFAHVVILCLISLSTIVFLTKPKRG